MANHSPRGNAQGNDSLASVVEGLQDQITHLKQMKAALQRDLQATRSMVVSLDQRENSHYREHSDKLDKLASTCVPSQAATGEPDLILATGREMTGDLARAARVFCGGPLLDAVQCARIFQDSKTFVDMPMKDDPEVILQAFGQMDAKSKSDPEALKQFVAKWFAEVESDNELWTPPDCKEAPERLAKIVDPEMRAWALEINRLWPTLGRRQRAEVRQNPQRYSAIPRTKPMVVPGGRFREMYYWDTYWVVRGLFISGMMDTAREVVENMVDGVKEFGFYPNGGRIYYLDRSQPPLLTAMVRTVYGELNDKAWLEKVLPALETEYQFWMDPKGGRLLELPKVDGKSHVLNIYRSVRKQPRPESYVEDKEVARDAEKLGRTFEELCQAMCSGAESGWDFSCRWLEDGTGRVPLGTANLATIDTCRIIPVDLNSILYDIEKTLSYFHKEVYGDGCDGSLKYDKLALARDQAMTAWLWSTDSYRDYRMDTAAHSAVVSLSDYAAPLWAGLWGPERTCASAMVASLKKSGMLSPCGSATTAVNTMGKTQWDGPNAWPPIQLMLIEGLDQLPGTGELADCLAASWLRTNYLTWKRTGFMHEKYDVFELGRGGAGGEYEPQVGFGWSNGVALALLVRPDASQNEPDVKRTKRS